MTKIKAEEEIMDKESSEQSPDKTSTEIDSQREELSNEEKMLRRLLNQWRYLDERFILEA